MSSWRHSAYLMPLIIAAASVFILQLKADYLVVLGDRSRREGAAGKKVFAGAELENLPDSGSGEEFRPPREGPPPEGRKIFMRPEKVCLSLNTFPANAYIIIDRRGRGRSPLTLKDMTPGKHLVEICKPGYTLQRVPVDLVTDERISIKLRKEPRPRLVRLAGPPEARSAEPPERRAAQKSAQKAARRDGPPRVSHSGRRHKKNDQVAGLMRDPLGAENMGRASWSLFR